jgi:hypothetical protein
MCNLKTWYTNPDGAIQQCMDCNCFQLIFGTTMFALEESRFKPFVDLVSHRLSMLVPMDEHLRYIVLPASAPTTRMVLNERELRSLNRMLQHTDTQITVAGLLDLFEIK